MCLECDKQHEQTQNGDEGVTLRHNSINEEVGSSRSVVTISEKTSPSVSDKPLRT